MMKEKCLAIGCDSCHSLIFVSIGLSFVSKWDFYIYCKILVTQVYLWSLFMLLFVCVAKAFDSSILPCY